MTKDSIVLTCSVAVAIIVIFLDFMYWRPL